MNTQNPVPRCRVLPLLLVLATFASAVPTAHGSTLVVTNLADSGSGTLRAQIAAANPGDTINFGVFGTVNLSSPLVVSKNLTINCGSAIFVKINGQGLCRVFDITAGSVTIANATIANGKVVGTNGASGFNGENVYGGGIRVGAGGQLGISGCTITNCVAVGGGAGAGATAGNAYGGAIACFGQLNLHWGNIISNSAVGGDGGAVDGGGQAWGGALYVDANVYVLDSTFSFNTATGGYGGGGLGNGAGGCIYNVGLIVAYNTTIASNAAASTGLDFGGGIDNYGTLLLNDCTFVGNRADYGGGITGGQIVNTILAGNSAANGPDGFGMIDSGDYNLIQNTAGITFSGTTTHNLTGVDPKLGPLQFNGGPDISLQFNTMSPLPGSPVIDKGKSVSSADQRLQSRPYDTSLANAAGGNGADIGAIEIHPATIGVANANASGAGSLRQALLDNNGLGGGNTIVFSNTVTGTISLGGVELTVAAPVKIVGPGTSVLTVSGNNSSRVFSIFEGPTTISGLTIADGRVVGGEGSQGNNGFEARGGGVYSQATLTLSNCVVRSNSVVGGLGGELHLGQVGQGGLGLGGGIYNASAPLQLLSSRFEYNAATGGVGGSGPNGDGGGGGNAQGGAVFTGGSNYFSVCSFTANLALGGTGGVGGVSTGNGNSGIGGQGNGGGIYLNGDLRIEASSFGDNSAAGGAGGGGVNPGGPGSGYGGGIFNVGNLGLLTVTLAGNTAVGSSYDFGGAVSSVGNSGLTNCTVAGNSADYGGGWHGDATVANSLFAGNSGNGADFSGTMNSFDYNLIQTFAGLNILGTTAHVIIGQDPLLGPLQDNGGPTKTMALLPGSPVIDKGMSFGLQYDQRGIVRPYNLPSVADAAGGDGSDMGAFEYLPTPTLNITKANGSAVLSWTTDAADYYLEYATSLPANSWLTVTNSRSTIGNQVYVTDPSAGSMKFYRLSFP